MRTEIGRGRERTFKGEVYSNKESMLEGGNTETEAEVATSFRWGTEVSFMWILKTRSTSSPMNMDPRGLDQWKS